MFSRNRRGELRASPTLYRFLLAAHVIVSVGWLGVSVAKLALAAAAVRTGDSAALYASMRVVDVVSPPAAVGTVLTGVLLSLGTRWGIFRHLWVLVKLVLTVGVILTGILLMERLIDHSIASLGQTAGDGAILGIVWAPFAPISLSVAHVLMLGAATVLSVYKPWGKARLGLRGMLRGEK